MRILFSSTPAHGHLLPQLPLARAFRDRGDQVAVMTAGLFAPVLAPEGIELLPAGPGADVLFAESTRRTGVDAAADPTPEAVAEFFAGTRIDLTADDALTAARAFAPDLIVAEAMDFVGPLAAAALEVPLATLAFGPAIPAEFTDGINQVAAVRYAERGLTPVPARWYLDPCPDLLQPPGWDAPQARLPLRPEPHQRPGQAVVPPAVPERNHGPRVLVTFGTHFSDPAVLIPILTELRDAGAELVVTLGLTARAEDFGAAGDGVTFTGFAPLAELLHDVDLVVTHGGAGTTLGALARGLPLVVVPQGADQFLQAAVVGAAGAGIAVPPGPDVPQAVANAVGTLRTDAAYADTARAVAEQIAAMPSPVDVAAQLADSLG
ncbi:glycosyltransferase [Myceligenerans xiligouense]|uniref:UDP:flavonoid glycosyltransferase YjiC (YdhE family) n=1 Tax=Myceligenerans xiligouense TaxID=253184 RepID=A0A3N4YN58_9MICO|nr:glycosyltransferase [Myceligenerans xiligouense]RPF19900.1 UDP:flavonoid glycosyltransferase YjiC (YdhE family) [Myceligenerans xiligouense]